MFKEKRMAYREVPENSEPKTSATEAGTFQDQLLKMVGPENSNILDELTASFEKKLQDVERLCQQKADYKDIMSFFQSTTESEQAMMNALLIMSDSDSKFKSVYDQWAKAFDARFLNILTKYGYDVSSLIEGFAKLSALKESAKARKDLSANVGIYTETKSAPKNLDIQDVAKFESLMEEQMDVWEKQMDQLKQLCVKKVSEEKMRVFIDSLSNLNDPRLNKLNNELVAILKTNRKFEEIYMRAGQKMDLKVMRMLAEHGYDAEFLMFRATVTQGNEEFDAKELYYQMVDIYEEKLKGLKKLCANKATPEEISKFMILGPFGTKVFSKLNEALLSFPQIKNKYDKYVQKQIAEEVAVLKKYGYDPYEFPLK